jgi:hypothetical protein
MEQTQNGKQIVQYPLGDLSDEEQRQLDEQLFVNDDYFERLVVTEDELIDDYLRGQLPERERQLFERTFLSSPHLRQRVNLARSLLNYIDDKARLAAPSSRGVPQILKTGLRQYKLYLTITALIRVALLGSLSLLLFHMTRTRGLVDLEKLGFVLWVSILCYAVLEVLSLFWSLKVANHAIARTRLLKNNP